MAGPGNDPLGRLRSAANRVVADNAQTFARITGAGLTLEQRAGRVWDIPAKMEIAHQIRKEEEDRSWASGAGRPHNDARDAMRHARWSQRTAQAAGPIFAEAAGIAHEAENFVDSVRKHRRLIGPYGQAGKPGMPPPPGETMDEIRMDLHNNAEGRRAAREGRPINAAKLQTRPDTPELSVLYRGPPSGRTFSGGR